ncbi:MAG: hydroxyacid dehydrogenase, partial [Planctomycetota bacterium]|nr:hydroxyacid dehydrogenase [Planctomycetota bacterium]
SEPAMKILISDAFDAAFPGKLQKFGDVTDDKSRLPECDVVLVRAKTKCTRDYIDEAKNLKLIIRGGVGIDNIDTNHAKERGILVRNTPTASSVAVAELAMALMLAIPNQLMRGHESMRQGKWLKKELKRTELMGKVLGLIGMGNIAAEVSKRARAFGMELIAYRKSGKPSEHAEVLVDLDDLLGRSDYVSLHTPLTEETRAMIHKGTIAKMKDGAVLINTARGACVVEADVAEALKSGKLGGYGNDVWASDPPGESPLIDAPNVVLIPHLGASSKENLLRVGDCIVELLEQYQAGTL